jgi:hypothetical protein
VPYSSFPRSPSITPQRGHQASLLHLIMIVPYLPYLAQVEHCQPLTLICLSKSIVEKGPGFVARSGGVVKARPSPLDRRSSASPQRSSSIPSFPGGPYYVNPSRGPLRTKRKGPGDLCGTLSGLEVTIPKASDFASFRADSLACSILYLPMKQEG